MSGIVSLELSTSDLLISFLYIWTIFVLDAFNYFIYILYLIMDSYEGLGNGRWRLKHWPAIRKYFPIQEIANVWLMKIHLTRIWPPINMLWNLQGILFILFNKRGSHVVYERHVNGIWSGICKQIKPMPVRTLWKLAR